MVQANTLLDEAFTVVCRIARLDADRGPAADTVEEVLAIEHRLHAEVRQEFPVEGAGNLEPTHREHDMSHTIDLDCHRLSSLVQRQDIMAC
jgi:hypothetical protein